MNITLRILFILACLAKGEVGAFQFTSDFSAGIYWASLPVGMEKFATTTEEGALLSSLLSQAENAWEDSLGSELWSIPSGFKFGAPTGNSIRWSNNFASETGFNPSTTLAVTIRYRTGTFFSRVEIILNGENQALRANLNNSLYQTILHEMGHVLGLDHSNSTNAIMFASLAGINSLSLDDIRGVNAVYDETVRRQSVGFVSNLAASEKSEGNALACGSVSLLGGGNGGGPYGGILTIIFSFALCLSFRYLPELIRKNFPLLQAS